MYVTHKCLAGWQPKPATPYQLPPVCHPTVYIQTSIVAVLDPPFRIPFSIPSCLVILAQHQEFPVPSSRISCDTYALVLFDLQLPLVITPTPLAQGSQHSTEPNRESPLLLDRR
ncbi:hypothetical protein LZ32DRAFT_155786 [Colletotrichum eremochloae]|nr:hypothetical protein LZ32DRAFT_155786 [Colletotrichum eremochloae]